MCGRGSNGLEPVLILLLSVIGKSVPKGQNGKEMPDNESENMSGTDPVGNSSQESGFQSAMLKMMSADFKDDISANVKESVAQVYQDFGYTDDVNSNEN